MLLGQPELNAILERPELRQLAQRITARYHLSPLSRKAVRDYIEHRLSVAGCSTELFTAGAIRCIYRRSQGIPRLINLICDRALLGVYSSNGEQVTARVVNRAAREVLAPAGKLSRWRPVWWALSFGVLIFAVTVLWKHYATEETVTGIAPSAAVSVAEERL